MFKLLVVLPALTVLVSCSNMNDACEDVTLASEQIQACQALHKQIINAKGDILIRTELDRRYKQDCIDIRYYRDGIQPATCGNKDKIPAIRKAVAEESQQ